MRALITADIEDFEGLFKPLAEAVKERHLKRAPRPDPPKTLLICWQKSLVHPYGTLQREALSRTFLTIVQLGFCKYFPKNASDIAIVGNCGWNNLTRLPPDLRTEKAGQVYGGSILVQGELLQDLLIKLKNYHEPLNYDFMFMKTKKDRLADVKPFLRVIRARVVNGQIQGDSRVFKTASPKSPTRPKGKDKKRKRKSSSASAPPSPIGQVHTPLKKKQRKQKTSGRSLQARRSRTSESKRRGEHKNLFLKMEKALQMDPESTKRDILKKACDELAKKAGKRASYHTLTRSLSTSNNTAQENDASMKHNRVEARARAIRIFYRENAQRYLDIIHKKKKVSKKSKPTKTNVYEAIIKEVGLFAVQKAKQVRPSARHQSARLNSAK